MKIEKWIFVAGAPRSGTTFVGKVLSIPLRVDYFHEPFNPSCGVPGVDQLYLYMRAENGDRLHYREAIERVFDYDFLPKTTEFREDPHWRIWIKRKIGSRQACLMRVKKLNPLYRAVVIKDPTGCLLTEYLVQSHNVQPVIVVRHPVAVVASFMRLGWKGNLEAIREQRELMEDYFLDEEQFFNEHRTEPIERVAVLWRSLNKVLLAQASQHPSWRVITHETLSRNPVESFRELYGALDLAWSPRVEKNVIRLTNSENPVQARKGQIHEFRRNSAGLLGHSLQVLSLEQRRKIYEITRDVALQVYSTESFQLDRRD